MKKLFPTEPPAFVFAEPRPRITYHGFIKGVFRDINFKPEPLACECGAALLGAKPNGPEHSDWCPLGVAR